MGSSIKTKVNEGGNMQRGRKVLQSMFFGDVSETEILTIVRKSKSKTSIDCDGTDMIIVKKQLTVLLNIYLSVYIYF